MLREATSVNDETNQTDKSEAFHIAGVSQPLHTRR